MPPSVSHPLLAIEVAEARAYQLDAVRAGLGANTLLVLPTGTGKTPVAWMVIAQRLHEKRAISPDSDAAHRQPWVLLIAPTNPLVVQHQREARKWLALGEEEIIALTGKISPNKREPMYDAAGLIISTPQVIRNDVNSGRLSLANCVLLVVDEAHHATGNHAMAQVGDLYGESAVDGLVLGCTASPGSTESQVSEVCDRLGIERIIARQSNDAMVSPYQQSMDIVEIRLPIGEEITTLAKPLNDMLEDIAKRLQRQGFLVIQGGISLRALRDAQQRISQAIAMGRNTAYQAARQNADAQRIVSLLYLLEGQGINSALSHLERLEGSSDGENSQSRFLAMPQVREVLGKIRVMDEVHPKIPEVKRLVKEQLESDPTSRVIVFATWRDSVRMLIGSLKDVSGVIEVERFVGQSSRDDEKGMSQKEQVEALDRFRDGESNVIVCTSVGEEGLDVPSADRVIFYEPVASEIRTIQRRGRTARHRQGDVFVLVSEDTRDVGVRYAAAAREARMGRAIAKVRRNRRPPRLHPRPDSLIESFTIVDGDENFLAADYISAEEIRLQPALGEAKNFTDAGKGASPEVPASRIVRRDAPPATPKSLRPKTQLSITEYLAPEKDDKFETKENEQSTSTSEGGAKEDNDWRQPILDGRVTDATDDVVLGHIQDLGGGQNGESGKDQSSS